MRMREYTTMNNNIYDLRFSIDGCSRSWLKVFMKQNFPPQFSDCIRRISENHNITSLIEFFNCLTF